MSAHKTETSGYLVCLILKQTHFFLNAIVNTVSVIAFLCVIVLTWDNLSFDPQNGALTDEEPLLKTNKQNVQHHSLSRVPAVSPETSMTLYWKASDAHFSHSWTGAHRLQVRLPCGGHPQAPSGQGSPCGFDGGSWEERGRRGSARGCWQTERTVSQLDCPLSGGILQHRSEHMHTHMEFWENCCGQECEEKTVYCGSKIKKRLHILLWKTGRKQEWERQDDGQAIARGRRETAELDSEGQVETETN